MERTQLGNTDLVVSRLGLGTVELGMPYGLGDPPPPSDVECIHLLRAAHDAGITFFDTAAAYGRSEELLGRAFAGPDPRPVIATKTTLARPGSAVPLSGTSLWRHVEESVQRSRRLLHAEALDAVQLHGRLPVSQTDELFAIMDNLSRRGWVRYWGASTYDTEAPLAAATAGPPLRLLQAAYSVLDRRLESKVLPACRRAGVGLVFRSVFLKGVLSDRLASLGGRLEPLKRAALVAAGIASAAGMSLPELALRFVAFAPFGQVTLFGTADMAEMRANLSAYAAGPLAADIIAALDGVRVEETELLNPSNWGQ